jgi:hypothetical protein
MTDINTFGAVMAFAIDLETRIRDYYQAAGDSTKAADADKRRLNLERVRRENVTEIKLEPIDDLYEADFVIDTSDISADGQRAVAATAARFYSAAAPKINVREAQRALEKAAKQHTANA